MQFDDTIKISLAAMSAQATRIRTVAENIGNAGSTANTPGGDPYRRKVVTFRNVLDRETGNNLVHVGTIARDASPFETKYQPGHPAADAAGYIRVSNVNPFIELNDLREAQRSYQANVDVIDVSKTMLSRAIDMLRS
jgi:flagellar basal-body rod protein FlgC